MIRSNVIIDTNVWLGALLGPAGPAREIIRLCLQGDCQPQVGNALFQEYRDVMAREAIMQKCLLSPEERHQLFADYLSVCRWVDVYYLWRPNLPDEADNHLVELAVASGASHIVTNNTRDFARTELLFDFKVRPPAQFLKEIRS